MMRLVVCLLTLGSLLAGAQQEPRWSQKYREGLRLLDQGRYYEAMGALALAAAENPRSSASPRYTPFYYLGVCYDKLGDRDRALEYYARELKTEALRSFPSDFKTAEERVEALLLTQDYDLIVTQPGMRPRDPPADPPAPSPEEEPAQPEPPPPTPEPTRPTPPASQPAARPEARPDSRPTPPATRPTPVPVEEREEASFPADRGRWQENLRNALSLFLAGDYPGALLHSRAVVDDDSGDLREKAAFIAGASLYAQYLLAGSAGESLREEALRYFRQCGSYQPPESWISPAILEFYRRR